VEAANRGDTPANKTSTGRIPAMPLKTLMRLMVGQQAKYFMPWS